jgi:thiol-disulfide isomerase/thioredoxin
MRAAIACLVLFACSEQAPVTGAATPSGSAQQGQVSTRSGNVELVPAPAEGGLAEFVAQEVARGRSEQVPVVVYVGATWCEPCRDFHAAAAAGTLDAALGPMRFLEFDLDRDSERLKAAGYRSQLVPLFARPLPDGRASGTQTDGVQTGGRYVEQLTPRIRELLAQ